MHPRLSFFSNHQQVFDPCKRPASSRPIPRSSATPRRMTSLVAGLMLLVCQHLPSVAQSLPDEEIVKKQAAATPIDRLLKIPADICSMRVSIEYPLDTDQRGNIYVPTPREVTFCEYAANLAAGQTGAVSEMKIWNVSAYAVPVVGFVSDINILFRPGKGACTFKNAGGKLVYAGMWTQDGRTGLIDYSAMIPNFAKCLELTHYYDGEKARGVTVPRQNQNLEPAPQTRMTSEYLQQLRDHLGRCWDVPASIRGRSELTITTQFQLNRDGSLAGEPIVLNRSSNPLFMEASRSVVAAIRKCQPFAFLPAPAYEEWRQVIVDFDPQEQ